MSSRPAKASSVSFCDECMLLARIMAAVGGAGGSSAGGGGGASSLAADAADAAGVEVDAASRRFVFFGSAGACCGVGRVF